MTEPTHPDDWREPTEPMPGADRTYVYAVGEDARVLVGLASLADEGDESRLDVATIEETGSVKRHDFTVGTFESEQVALEAMASLMRLLGETLPSDGLQDERLFMAVQQCIEAFDSPAHDRHPSEESLR